MKTLFKILLVALTIVPCEAQESEYDIETKSVEIDDLISFVVQNYDAGDVDPKNITFLIQLKEEELDGEHLVMLKQSFKLISERLSNDSQISILTYSKFNGVALKRTNAKELKLILHTLTDLKGNIAEFYKDGISLGYKHAEDNYADTSTNSLVMIRINSKAENQIVDIHKEEKKEKKKKKGDALLVTALALLPEIIDIIKN